jgi:hypothetical protein
MKEGRVLIIEDDFNRIRMGISGLKPFVLFLTPFPMTVPPPVSCRWVGVDG